MSTPKTPRLRSAFPHSPRPTIAKAQNVKRDFEPVIPLTAVDGPSQRLYAAAIYALLCSWKLWDYLSLLADESSSLWLFVKWTALDGIFLYGLPTLRIPWLEWSAFTTSSLFLGHAVLNAICMFQIPIPVHGWVVGIGKIFYDREIAISEKRVKPASLVQNSSLILGKQIINILPEGTAVLNSEQRSFCISKTHSTAVLELRLNQTVPISIELTRTDFDGSPEEVVSIGGRELRRIKKEAAKGQAHDESSGLQTLRIPVSKTGLYRLKHVIDESNLLVQGTESSALVVQCPAAALKQDTLDRCRGDLSDFSIEVVATPPIRIDYTRTIGKGHHQDSSTISLTWHPEDMDSPGIAQKISAALIGSIDPQRGLSWANTRRHTISINETMTSSGRWQYRIDKIEDGCGNLVDYTGDHELPSARGMGLEKDLIVHQRPQARLEDCTLQTPLRLPRGQGTHLPIALNPNGQADTSSSKHHVRYSFTHVEDEDHTPGNDSLLYEQATISSNGQGPLITEAGTYKLLSVASDFCLGEVLEPSSCMLVNPPAPDVSLTSDEIPDKCAGHSVGILANLDLVGSPPFSLFYTEQRRGGPLVQKSVNIGSLRHQLAFEPREAGHYSYTFNEISDSVYTRPRQLGTRGRGFRVEQDIKPTSWARFENPKRGKGICLDQKTSFNVVLSGDGPWALEYDLVHGKSRQKKRLEGIETDRIEIETPELSRGGEYSVTLTSVTDHSGCKIFLDQEAIVQVRQEKPTAGFAPVDGSRVIQGLQNERVRLPLRLSGEGPWTVTYINEDSGAVQTAKLTSSNAYIEVARPGAYTLQKVKDATCQGVIEASASSFHVRWIDRPAVQLAAFDEAQQANGRVELPAVCEGLPDSLDLALAGKSPFKLEYQISGKPAQSSQFVSSKKETYASNLASIRMETSKAGRYKYSVNGVGDQFYDLPKKKGSLLTVEQKVHPRPRASFLDAGRTYSHCKVDTSGAEPIPVSLHGTPPFSLQVEVRQKGNAKPEVITMPSIPTNRHNLQIPARLLQSGGYSVSLSHVSDGNGCDSIRNKNDRQVVHVSVVDVPSIAPIEDKVDYCVGDRISYTLAGTPPFNVFYRFENAERKAAVSGTVFRRLAEKPGVFAIGAVSDKVSTDSCRAAMNITKNIHPLPSAYIDHGKTKIVDMHEGSVTEIRFEFGGTPPFEFTYTRSTNEAKGKRSVVLETMYDVSEDYKKSVTVSEEGTYEVVAVRDRYCGVTLRGRGT